ncbi:hypothetical protein GCM10009716_23960 [Streptomyces sodiiphilus]|uniref:Uncharacterized protein n=1 Tax=Streptomyces sodiiphilus TaxID=226217 RepID=A0ABN2P661_9ACTN
MAEASEDGFVPSVLFHPDYTEATAHQLFVEEPDEKRGALNLESGVAVIGVPGEAVLPPRVRVEETEAGEGEPGSPRL